MGLRILFLVMIALAVLQTEVQAQEQASGLAKENPQEIRVRVHQKIKSFDFHATGLSVQGKAAIEPVAIPVEKSYRVILKNNLWIVQRPAPQQADVIRSRYLELSADVIESLGKWYSQKILLIAKNGGAFDVVAEMPVEQYLVGVVSSEMPMHWPLEALKAQAVSARSYAYATILERKHREFHVEATVLDQVFRVLSPMQWTSPSLAKVVEAVRTTRGEVVSDASGRVVKAFYHSHCGGRTVDAQFVWGGRGLGTAVDKSCALSEAGKWKTSVSAEEIRNKLGGPEKIGEIASIQAMTNREGDSVWIGLASGKVLRLRGNDFRSKLGYALIASTQFHAKKVGDQFSFEGRGRGHGVGLCQYGARAMALQSKSYREILRHYYPLSSGLKDLQRL